MEYIFANHRRQSWKCTKKC